MGKKNWFSTHAQGTNDPPEVRNLHIHMVAAVAAMSALAMGYDTAVIGGTMALDSFVDDFNMSSLQSYERDTVEANIVSTFQAGCFFGALFTFPLAEKFGRRIAIMCAACVFLLGGTLMTAAMGNMNMIYAGRLVAGLGIGASSLCVPVYISETAPPSIRGRLVGIFEIASQGGGMLGFWINYATDQTIPDTSKSQWIVPLAIQLIPGVLLLLGMLFVCPESPRWLARGDDFEAAEKILTRLRGLGAEHPYVVGEMAEIREQVQRRQANTMTMKEQFKRLFEQGVRNRMGVGIALMFLQSFTGVNIVSYYAPRIFESMGITGTSNKLFSTGLYGVFKTLGMIAFTLYVVERVGRRKGLIWGAAIGCIPMFYIGGYVLVAGITWTYAAEIFPLDIRMLCVALTTADTWLGSFIVARTTPYMITGLGYGMYFVFGSILIAMGVWALFFVPETKGRPLEEMDALFSVPTSKTCWATIRNKPLPFETTVRNGGGSPRDSIDMEKGEMKEVERKL